MSGIKPRATTIAIPVRDAAVQDMSAIQAIYAHHVLHGLGTFDEVPPSIKAMTARFQELRALGFPYLVAEEPLRGTIMGYSYAASFRPRSAYRHTVEDSVYVHPDHRGQGIGKALLAALVQRCQDLGYHQMVAVIGDSGNAASIALHQASGFENLTTLKAVGFKFGRWVDCVFMQRDLSRQPLDEL